MGKKEFDWDAIPVKTGATANPAAGANPAAVTVPTGKRWLLLTAYCFCDTSANAATRYPIFNIKHDGTNTSWNVIPGTWVAADGDQNIHIGAGVANQDLSASGCMMLALPVKGIEMGAGAIFQLTIGAIDAADDLGPLYYVYKEAPA